MKIATMLAILISFFTVTGNAFAAKGKQDVCHKGQTINISTSAVKAHLGHGDSSKSCEQTNVAVALFRCGPDLTIQSVSTSGGLPKIPELLGVGTGCAGSIRVLMNHGFEPIHIDSVYDATSLGIVTDYGYAGPRISDL